MKKGWPLVAIGLALIISFSSALWAQEKKKGSSTEPREEGGGAVVTRVFVSPQARERIYDRVVIMPFRAATDLAGASLTDLFSAELLAWGKYQVVERTQMELALSEQAEGQKEMVFDTISAIKLGKRLGVPGVIIGTVPEYEVRASKKTQTAVIGITIRMIDVTDGSLVWSLTDTAVSDKATSLSAFTAQVMRKLVTLLSQEMTRMGDLSGAGVPIPKVAASQGKIRGTLIEIQRDPPAAVAAYKIRRGQTEQGPFQEIGQLPNAENQPLRFEDSGLADGVTYYYQIVAVAPTQMVSRPSPPLKIMTAGPPGIVTGLTAQSGLIRQVVLTWQPLKDPAIRGYQVLRQTGSGPWEKIKVLEGPQQAAFTDPELADQTTYAYRIVAVNQVGSESAPSPAVRATTKGPPGKVSKLEAVSLQPRRVPLKWTPVDEPEVKGYAVFRASAADGPFEKIALVEGKDNGEFVDGVKRGFFGLAAPLQDETRYYYKVQAVNIVDVHGPDSPADNAVTKPVPEPVQGLEVNQREVKQVSLRWRANEEPDIVTYQVFRGRDPQALNSLVAEIKAPETQGVDRGLEDGSKYFYRVRAVDRDGLEGRFSVVAEAATKPVPSKPTGLQARLEGKTVRLRWQANPENDIKKYILFQKSFLLFWEKIGEAAATEFVYQGEMKKGKTLTFRLTAVDGDQLEGPPSEQAEITIP